MLCGLVACSDDDGTNVDTKVDTQVVKVAVLMDGDEAERWKSTAQWALDNLTLAQQGLTERVELQLAFYNQEAEDIDETMRQIAEDTTIVAVVGPTCSDCATLMAKRLSAKTQCQKPMITPSATGVEYQRTFANTSYVWNLAESDIAQLEVLIAEAASTVYNEPIVLLAANDGNDYSEWFGFIAEEYGLTVDGIYLYSSEQELRTFVRQLCGNDIDLESKIVLFNPSSTAMALAFDDEIQVMWEEARSATPRQNVYVPTLYCTDAFVNDRIAATVSYDNYRGVDLYASPESGFGTAYRQYFNRDLVDGEAQFYDALCLVAYAAVLKRVTGQTLNEAIQSVVDGRDGTGSSWLPLDMRNNLQKLAQGITPDIDGVSGSWTFDEQTHSCVVGSTFRWWNLYKGSYLTTEYVSTEGGKRTSSSKNLWDWTSTRFQTFGTSEGEGFSYPALDERWALLVAASEGWSNYRFQADVFAMYQILKQHGYDDDHIVLVCEDDLAYNSKNPEQGVLRVRDDGENLYEAAAVDYRLSDLTAEDIGDILQGKQSDRLPKVLHADADDNVFVFWSSHGNSDGSFNFGASRTVSYGELYNGLAGTPHRKMMVAVEACYSGGLGEYCTGLPGVLFVTAANPYETSHAAVWSGDLGVYRSNGFTRGFQEAIAADTTISLRDLYYHLAQNTSASHVKVYNAAYYGNVYDNNMGDYLGK